MRHKSVYLLSIFLLRNDLIFSTVLSKSLNIANNKYQVYNNIYLFKFTNKKKNMSNLHYLTADQLAAYRKKLQNKRVATHESMERKREEAQSIHDVEPDLIDIASNVETRTRLMSEVDRDIRILQRIDSALQNFDSDFGYCSDCGVEIGEKRLDFDPSASRCFDCQDIFEKKSRLYARS